MGLAVYGVNLKPMMDVEDALANVKAAKAAKELAAKKLAEVELEILNLETRTGLAAPMGLQRRYTEAVKASNKANGNVSRAEAALSMALAKAKRK